MRSTADVGAFLATLFAGAVYVAVIASQDEPVGLVTWIVGAVLAFVAARRRD